MKYFARIILKYKAIMTGEIVKYRIFNVYR